LIHLALRLVNIQRGPIVTSLMAAARIALEQSRLR
jgi:hypothetical protein